MCRERVRGGQSARARQLKFRRIFLYKTTTKCSVSVVRERARRIGTAVVYEAPGNVSNVRPRGRMRKRVSEDDPS